MRSRFVRPLLFFAFLAAVGVVSLADRAPGMVASAWQAVRRVGSFAEQTAGLDLIDRGDIPFAMDTIGHLVLWSIAGGLAYLAFGRRTSVGFLIVSLITLSAGVEVGQGLLSSTRHPEIRDLVANSVGVTFGVLSVAALFAVIGVFGRISSSLIR